MGIKRIEQEFEMLFEQTFSCNRNEINVKLQQCKLQEMEIIVQSGNREIFISGQSLSAVMAGVCLFFEQCGIQFLISETKFSLEKKWKEIPSLNVKQNTNVPNRGIRMHLNFAQDQSFFTEEDFQAFIQNMSRMKMNYLLFHMYNGQEWFPFTYRGMEHLELELGNFGKKPLSENMIGREKVLTKEIWYPREFEGVEDIKQLRTLVMERYQRMMKYAKELGIRLAASFEPEVLSKSFEEKIIEWTNEESHEKISLSEKEYNLTIDWQEGWSGKKIAEVDTLHPILLDAAVERALALYKAYPLIGELHLISREGTSFLAESREAYMTELNRLEESLGIVFEESFVEELFKTNEETEKVNPKAYPYWTVLPGNEYISSFLGAIRYLEFAKKILKDARMKQLEAKQGLEFVISLYSPNPNVIRLVNLYAGKILPNHIRFDILGDYGAKDICEQLKDWEPLLKDHKKIGMISWLEFDGNMDLTQGWTKAIYDNVAKASSIGINTIYFNHWRIRSLEQNAHVAAAACFWKNHTYEEIIKQYCQSLYGEHYAEIGILAYEALEEVTDFAKNHHYNIGFTNDWVYLHSTDTPGYKFGELEHSIGLYKKAKGYFSDLSRCAKGHGQRHAAYMADMCEASGCHLHGVYYLQKSKLPLIGHQCFPVTEKGNWPDSEQMADVVHNAYLALQYEYAYMKYLAKWAEGSDEQGQLAHHQLGTIEVLEMHHTVLKEKYEESVKVRIGE